MGGVCRPSSLHFLEVVNIFDWLGDILGGIGSAVGGVFDTIGDQVSAAIWDAMIR